MVRRDQLGSPRPGNPEQLFAYAQFLKNEAVKAGDFAQHEGTIASRLDFHSRGAKRLYANMSEVASSFVSAADTLDHAAQMIIQFARRLGDDQASWLRQRTEIDGRMADIANALARRSA
jgi:hypothetical protein